MKREIVKKNHNRLYETQDINNLGKIENGIVVVSAYRLWDNITFLLTCEVYKPKEHLKPNELCRTKPEIAAAMIRALCERGFSFDLVLVDSLYGESGSNFVCILQQSESPTCQTLVKMKRISQCHYVCNGCYG